MSQNILFEDIFEIKNLNENGKKFERGTLSDSGLRVIFVFNVYASYTSIFVQ